MRKLLNPKWLFVLNTLPLLVLCVLSYAQFKTIHPLLDEESIQLWKYFAGALGVLGLSNAAYAVFLTLKKRNISVAYGLLALLSYIPFIYLHSLYFHELISASIPRWMLSGNIRLHVGTFFMPTLVHALLVCIAHCTSENKEHKAWKNFLMAISIPVSGYVFVQVMLPLRKEVGTRFYEHAFLTLGIVGVVVFLFFVVRGIWVFATKNSALLKEHAWLWKTFIALVLPLLGLMENNGYGFFSFSEKLVELTFLFGDFSSPWFYVLAVMNGIFVCLPSAELKAYRLFLFVGRGVCFSYTLYFFLVFLPFLPVSAAAIPFSIFVIPVSAVGAILFAAGVLMLVPLLLFVIHLKLLSKDFSFLSSFLPGKYVAGIFLSGFLVVPLFVTAAYVKDKNVLYKALEYVYSPDYSKEYRVDKNSLQKTLEVVKQHKRRNGSFDIDFVFSSGKQLPYLSSYFNWLVFDNLTLSDAKIKTIEKIFFGETSVALESWNRPNETIQNENVDISHISTRSVYDEAQNAWKSWVDLEITNQSEDTWRAEYATTIQLPEGAWVSDYYLYVGDKKEPGILSEKKSAMWVYSQIRNENRDPGILYYLTGNTIAFRVFPFGRNETRKTGIEFLHKEPMQLKIDKHIVELGNVEETLYENIENEKVAYVSSRHKKTLKSVSRTPRFHFLVDVSKGKDKHIYKFAERIEVFLKRHAQFSENAHISFVNSHVHALPLAGDWKKHYERQTFEGGFYLDRAVRHALLRAHKDSAYAVLVVVTDDIQSAVLDKDFADLKFAFPENNLFFNLREGLSLHPHSLIGDPKTALTDNPECLFCETVLEYRLADNSVAYLPDDDAPNIVFKEATFSISEQEAKEKAWQSALDMQAKWASFIIHPETSDKEWRHFVRHSFLTKIMTPATAYLVVENEAQKAILKKKQEHILSSKNTLDFEADPRRMSEPSMWVLAALLGLALWARKVREGRRGRSHRAT